jgi:putative hemolysin
MRSSLRRLPTLCVAVAMATVVWGCQSVQTPVDQPETPKKISAADACALQQLAASAARIDAFLASSSPDSTLPRMAAESRAAIANAELQTCLASH